MTPPQSSGDNGFSNAPLSARKANTEMSERCLKLGIPAGNLQEETAQLLGIVECPINKVIDSD